MSKKPRKAVINEIKEPRVSDLKRWLVYGVFWVICPTMAIILFKSLEAGKLIVLDQYYTEIVLLVWTVSLNCKIVYEDKKYSIGKKFKYKPLIGIVYTGLVAGPYYSYLKGSSVTPPGYRIIMLVLVGLLLVITVVGCIFSTQSGNEDEKE